MNITTVGIVSNTFIIGYVLSENNRGLSLVLYILLSIIFSLVGGKLLTYFQFEKFTENILKSYEAIESLEYKSIKGINLFSIFWALTGTILYGLLFYVGLHFFSKMIVVIAVMLLAVVLDWIIYLDFIHVYEALERKDAEQ